MAPSPICDTVGDAQRASRRYALRVSRSVVVSLSLSPRNGILVRGKAVARGSWLAKAYHYTRIRLWPNITAGRLSGRPLQSPTWGIFNIEKGCHRVTAFFCIGIGLESGLMISRMAFLSSLFSRCNSARDGSCAELTAASLGDDAVVIAIAEVNGQA